MEAAYHGVFEGGFSKGTLSEFRLMSAFPFGGFEERF